VVVANENGHLIGGRGSANGKVEVLQMSGVVRLMGRFDARQQRNKVRALQLKMFALSSVINKFGLFLQCFVCTEGAYSSFMLSTQSGTYCVEPAEDAGARTRQILCHNEHAQTVEFPVTPHN
jgi:hypothetical protein